ncbi:MAG: DEAD/DEAH box helicase [Eubacteriales bacterium]|nr:DEAD/DEAH box helicase [Eubacteriales bacterium]
MLYNEILDLNPELINILKNNNISEMTPIQAQTFKHINNNRDLIACSGTGTGKTFSYLVPLINNLSENSSNVQILILVPTGELAAQVNSQAELLLSYKDSKFHSIFVTGDGNLNRQIEKIKSKPSVLVGTPSRVLQLIKSNKLKVHEVKSLVLDEADKLINTTYIEQVSLIRKSLMKYTQVLLFSASIDKKTRKAANSLTFKAIDIDLNNMNQSKSLIPTNIKHLYVVTDRRERVETLRKLIKATGTNKAIVFINTKYDLEESYQKLEYHNYKVGQLSSNQNNIQKKTTLDRFKNNNIQILLTTDIASRGLQLDNVDTVINLNLPEESKDYIHRAGRCGRNGNKGVCISIITENELNKIKKYQKDLHINVIQKKLYQGKLVAK